jgi:hypothetical protein
MTSHVSLSEDLSPTTASAATPLTIPTSHPHQHLQPSHPPSYSPLRNALKGLKVVIIHVKEPMTDGPKAGEVILDELVRHEREARLGVEFVVSEKGQHFCF